MISTLFGNPESIDTWHIALLWFRGDEVRMGEED